MPLQDYTTGTVSVPANGTVVTGVGPLWFTNARAGDTLLLAGHEVTIQDITDETHLAIDPWPYASVATAAYKIIFNSTQRVIGAQGRASVDRLVAALETDGFYIFVKSSLTDPDPSLGNDGQYAFQPSTGKLWIKNAGVWLYLGIYKGFGFKGAYSSSASYTVNDVVTYNGASYLSILSSINQTPTNTTYWALLSAKGDQGIQGIQGASYGGTSTTSLTIGSGSKVFTTQSGFAYTNGARIRASSSANTSDWMEGIGTYSGTTLTINVDKFNGSGTLASWNFNVVGQPGAGDMSSANNLSDLADKIVSGKNLSSASSAKTSAYTVVASDGFGLMKFNGTFNVTYTTAATLGDKWRHAIKNIGTGVISLVFNGTGEPTTKIYPGEACDVVCDGVGFYTIGRSTGLVLITRAVLTNVASATWDNVFSTDFEEYQVDLRNFTPTGAGAQALVWNYRRAGATVTGTFGYAIGFTNGTGVGAAGNTDASTGGIVIAPSNVMNGANNYCSRLRVINPMGSVGLFKQLIFDGQTNNANNARYYGSGCVYTDAAANDGFSLYATNANFSGIVEVYGIRS